MENYFSSQLVMRFYPFYFLVIPGFANVVLDIEDWGGCVTKFREDDEDHPT